LPCRWPRGERGKLWTSQRDPIVRLYSGTAPADRLGLLDRPQTTCRHPLGDLRGSTSMNDDSNPARLRPDESMAARIGLGSQVSAKRTELQLPALLPLGTWARVGQQIALLGSSSAWWLGDWLIYGRKSFPDRYKQAMVGTSLDYQTLRNYAWVAGRFPVPRRRDTLSFQHHAAVASLPPAQQDAWLDLASSLHWSLAQLRGELKTASRQRESREGHDTAAIELTVSEDRYDRWETAAHKEQKKLVDWLVAVIDEVATQILDGPLDVKVVSSLRINGPRTARPR
jgi:hypothetical protein